MLHSGSVGGLLIGARAGASGVSALGDSSADASHLRALFESSRDAILLTQADGTVLRANREACRLFQRDPDEMVGLPSEELTDGDDQWTGSGSARSSTGYAGVVTMRRSDGSLFDVDATTTAFRDATGRALRYVFLRDVTERDRAEKALLASEHRYRSFVETAGNVIIGVAPDGMIVEWNREAERIFGRTRRDALGKDYFQLLVEPGRRDATRRDFARVLNGESLRYREVAVVAPSGERRVILWSVSRLVDVSSATIGVLATGQDVSEQKQLEAQMQHAQKLESLGVLAGGIAHDFNNLLVGMLGNASLVLMDLDEASPLFAMVKDIETTALRAADLTRQMLAYSGRGRFTVRPVDMASLVEEMAHLLRTVISKRAALHFDFAPGPNEVEADVTQLRQIVMNLITNASDALNNMNGTITLRTGVIDADAGYLRSPYLEDQPDAGRYAYVEVEDTGSGMTDETMQRIFDPFFSTKFSGRGLGLAATLGIVRSHRGTIKVASRPGHGTTFRVLLPARAAIDERSDAVSATADRVRGSGTALVVDDDPTVRGVARTILERRGFRVCVAANGEAGLALYLREREAITVALIDLTMPEMSGDELKRRIRACDATLPLIVMSGYGETELAPEVEHDPCSGFVQKPFRLEELDRAMRQVMAR